MNYKPRILKRELRKATAHFPALLVTGPRRSGNTPCCCKSSQNVLPQLN